MSERKDGMVKMGWILLVGVMMAMLPVFSVQATHLRAGEITVTRQSCSSRIFIITVTVYTDTGSPVLFGGPQDVLDFGDGTRVLVPETPNSAFPGLNIGKASYSIAHTFPGPGRYTISYLEPNRNEGILNINNSVNTTFYLETQVDLTVLGCDNSPVLLVPPIDQACRGVAFFHNPGAFDPDGDSLSYELVVPFRDRNTPVLNYRDPNNSQFYSGLNYAQANEAGDGEPTFAINPVDGTLTWDAPGAIGEYNVAFVVNEWRNINNEWVKIGYVRRDMQIIVSADCTNDRPRLEVPEDVCVVAGTQLRDTVRGYDPENHNVKIEAFSEIFDLTSPATVTPTTFQSSNPEAKLAFEWNTICEHVKSQAYQVVFKITDDPRSSVPPTAGPPLVTFATWQITVVAPPPVLQTANVNLAMRHVTLDWDAYECYEDASTMQVWRRVGETTYAIDSCFTGMPESLGYTKIAEIPIKNGTTPVTTYTDTNGGKGLEANAKYCYRLAAIFPLPRGGESYVSNEICIDPILTSEPVITKVSVEKTGDNDGEVLIEWLPPLDIDPGQFPGPYEYLVQRASGTGFVNVSGDPPATLTATSFVDAGLDTRDETYFYRIILYSPTITEPTPQPIDTSSIASTVRLRLRPMGDQIELNWSATVPWSNQLQTEPLHDIYRGPAGSAEGDLVFLETVDVLQNGFTYVDDDPTLDENTEYCYRVMTRGGYGIPLTIPEPLENFSQINCARPRDDEPPCTPIVAAFPDDCSEFVSDYGCNPTNFTNTIRWSLPEQSCEDVIESYNVYVASSVNGSYFFLANVQDTFYLHQNLSSLARCYKVEAVNRSGIVGALSDPVCNDNCPYYEIPNVFSPNGDKCNDILSAFGYIPPDATEDCPISPENSVKCARFVQRVVFTVYNRWGKEVYSYVGQQGDENTIYINWNGRDDQGRELASAVYYYSAEVTFDVVNPNDRVKLIKGWVHLVR
jgi:hypothetical protein